VLKKRQKTKSFNRRIIVTVSLANLIFWLIACLFAALVMYEEYEEAFDGALRLSATRILPLALRELENVPNHLNLKSKQTYSPEYSTYQLLDAQGKVILRSSSAPQDAYGVPLDIGFFYTDKWRIYSLASDDGMFFIQVADRMSERKEAALEAMTALLLPALLFMPLMMLIIAMLLKQQLRPVQHLGALIGEKDSGNMQMIETKGIQQEFVPIITSVNNLLTRLKSALDAERSFTANSAHEIRTPIAAALAHTQLLRQDLPKHYQGRAEEVETALQRLAHLSEKLLQLARADAFIGQAESPCDLLPFIEAVLEDFRRIGHDHRLKIDCKTKSLIHQINGDAFSIIIRNLLENALNHSSKNSPVTMTITADKIVICNDCDAVAENKMREISKRFYRGTQEGKGAGLGLSIIDSLLQSMPISIIYQSPISGQARGFCVTLSLQ